MKPQKPFIKIALGGPWRSLHPGLQHTLWADLVLSNQYEALVGLDQNGAIVPLGAKSWKLNDDFTQVEFEIDTSKTFSDGVHLRSGDYKRSWEDALKLTPISHNNSLGDVLAFIQGYDQFSEAHTISGIDASVDDILKIRFKRPFRMVLTRLTGNRFSAYRVDRQGTFIGTGKYVIKEVKEDLAHLFPRSDLVNAPKDPIELSVVYGENMDTFFKSTDIDALGYTSGHRLIPSTNHEPNFAMLTGPEATHLGAFLNQSPGVLFADVRHRKAIQYLLLKIISDNIDRMAPKDLFYMDPQMYFALQQGRLSPDLALQLVEQGKEFVPLLIEASKTLPIRGVVTEPRAWILDELKKYQVNLAANIHPVKDAEMFKVALGPGDFDFLFWSFSVAGSDPDGLYHKFGKHGAIQIRSVYNERVGALLEEGRAIVDFDKIDAHYQKVSRAFLEEVPFVHAGFSRAAAFYRKDRVEVNDYALRRNEGHLDVFRLK